MLASFILKEELGRLGRVGCTLCLVGTVIIILNAPEDKEIRTVDEILNYALQPGECAPETLFAIGGSHAHSARPRPDLIPFLFSL